MKAVCQHQEPHKEPPFGTAINCDLLVSHFCSLSRRHLDLTRVVRHIGTAKHFVGASSWCFSVDNYHELGRGEQEKKKASDRRAIAPEVILQQGLR